MFRQFGEFHETGVGQIVHRLQPWDRWNGLAGSRIDEDHVALEDCVSSLNEMAADESRLGFVEMQIRAGVYSSG